MLVTVGVVAGASALTAYILRSQNASVTSQAGYGYRSGSITMVGRVATTDKKASYYSSPLYVSPTQQVQIKWSTRGVNSCIDWNGKKVPTQGQATVGPFSTPQTLNLYCSGKGWAGYDYYQIIPTSPGY
jgi:hypothetical protein